MKVTLEHITKRYQEVTAVDDITMEFESGKLICLLGPSGSGKTTLLFLLAGLLSPDTGKILFDDIDVTAILPKERAVGVVFQDFGLFPYQTVEETISFPIELQSLTREERAVRVLEIAKLLHIEELLKRKTDTLSAGQKQRVAIGRALAKSPKLLLLDESLNHLDESLRKEMRKEIRNLQKELGITMIFVTHSSEEAEMIADQIIYMDKGKIAEKKSNKMLKEN